MQEKVPGLGRFPSDHWGLLTDWTYGSKLPIAASSERVLIDLDA